MGRCWSRGTKFQLCELSSGNLMYDNVPVVNNIVYLKFANKADPKCYYHVHTPTKIIAMRWIC